MIKLRFVLENKRFKIIKQEKGAIMPPSDNSSCLRFQYNFKEYELTYPTTTYEFLKNTMNYAISGVGGKGFEYLAVMLFEDNFFNTDSINTIYNRHNEWYLHDKITGGFQMAEFITDYQRFRLVSLKDYFSNNIPEYIEKYGTLTIDKINDLPSYYVDNISYLFQLIFLKRYSKHFNFNKLSKTKVNNRLRKLSECYSDEKVIKRKLKLILSL